MKRFIIFLFAAAAAVSCKVVDPYQPNQLNDKNISTFCATLFDEEVKENLTYFYNAYAIAKFLDADAEEKVSAKYDIIRTGLRSNDGSYTFDYDDYTFSVDPPFAAGSSWKVKCSYHKDVNISVLGDGKWKITCTDDGTILSVDMLEEKDDMMLMSVTVKGQRTEESSYSADFSSSEIEVTVSGKKIGKIESMSFNGEMIVKFKKDTASVKTCIMTMVPGLTTLFDVF